MAGEPSTSKITRFGFGLYPEGYNPKVHGPYNPATYYGKPDTAFKDVKVGELFQWMSRRSVHPMSMISAISRFGWRYAHKWMIVQKPTMVPITQIIVLLALYHGLNSRNPAHNKHKYHW